MENSPFGAGHLPSQALVVLSEAASGLHEALRNQRSFQPRLPDVKDLHNMSLVGNYGSHLLHNFHPHLLQSLNPNVLSNGNPNNFFATDRTISKPILSSFQIPSAFSPPKYIGISLEQNLFNGNESFRTDSTSPISVSPLTKNDSLEGQSEYETDKGESPRSNPDTRDFRHVHIKSNPSRSPMTDCCPVCGIQLTMEEWNTHFLTELDRLYKLSSGMDRSNLQSNFMFGQCSNADNSLRSSHNRWETFQRIRNNRQNRLRIKVRKRKCSSDLYVLENLFCNSCPVCRRKFPSEGVKNPEESRQIKDEIETVDVESCCDDVPDSGSEIHSTNKVEGVLYKSVCLINKETAEDVSNSWDSISNFNNKAGNELSSTTTTQFYNADSCGDRNFKENETVASNNESDEDVVVDDDTVKICRKRKFDDELSSRSGNNSPEDGQQSEAQVTSTEQPDTSNKYSPFEERTTNLSETDCQNFKVGKEDEYKCFICKKGLENRSNFFRGRTVYFHQDCANVMSSCRLGKVNN